MLLSAALLILAFTGTLHGSVMDVALSKRHELSLSMSKPYSVSRTFSLTPKHCGLLTDKVTFT